MRILIVGAGIAGLGFAALTQQAHDITIIEKAPSARTIGLGIGLWPNAFRILERIGVHERVLSGAHRVEAADLRTIGNRQLYRMDTNAITLEPFAVVAREDLHAALLHEVEGIRYNTTVAHLEEKDDGVHVGLTDGTQGTYDLVVGADGVRSQMRTLLFPEVQPEPVGHRWWSLLNARLEERSMAIHVGTKQYIGTFPRKGQGTYVLFIGEDDGDGSYEALCDAFQDADQSYLRGVEDPRSVISAPVVHVHSPWYDGRVVLIGDAAHTTTPMLGIGATLALEDAAVLASVLDRPVPEALAAFAAERTPNKQWAAQNAWLSHMFLKLPGPLSKVRDALTGSVIGNWYQKQAEAMIGMCPVKKSL